MEDYGPQLRLRFESRVLTLAKDADYPEENQDVIRVDEERGTAAIADGVSSSIFARQWARILVEAALSGLPDPDDREALARWLAEHRAAWSRQIDVSRLAWFQRPKLREGAFSTLLCVRLVAPGEGPERGWRLQSLAVGDSCLFLVRDGTVLRKFPIQASAELESDPVVLGSVDLNRDERLSFHRLDEPCQAGDLVVLCTDAVADWALRLEESGSPPSWQAYWDKPESAWQEEILAMRAERQIRCDDATLGLLRITDGERVALPKRSDGSGEASVGAAAPFVAQGVPSESAPEEVSCPEGSGRVTLPERSDGSGESSRDAVTPFEAQGVPPEPPPVPDLPPAAPLASPDDDWVRRIAVLSERAAEGLSHQVARGMEQLKRARKAAQSKIKDYLDQLREDDR